jgi:hypothetical protein
MGKNFLKVTFSGLMILVLLMTVSLAYAQGGARVYLQPVDSAEGTLTVDVIVENVSELYGAEFRLRYDPAVLSVQDLNANQSGIQIESGTLLPADQGFVVANKVDEAQGVITFAMTLLNPAPAVSGTGPLARVTFNTLQGGGSTISVEHAKLVAADLQTIASETADLSFGAESEADTGPPPPTDAPSAAAGESNFPWWIIAVIVMVLGVVVLGGLIVMGGSKSRSIAPATSQQPHVRQQRPAQPRPTGSRPSAFNRQQSK